LLRGGLSSTTLIESKVPTPTEYQNKAVKLPNLLLPDGRLIARECDIVDSSLWTRCCRGPFCKAFGDLETTRQVGYRNGTGSLSWFVGVSRRPLAVEEAVANKASKILASRVDMTRFPCAMICACSCEGTLSARFCVKRKLTWSLICCFYG